MAAPRRCFFLAAILACVFACSLQGAQVHNDGGTPTDDSSEGLEAVKQTNGDPLETSREVGGESSTSESSEPSDAIANRFIPVGAFNFFGADVSSPAVQKAEKRKNAENSEILKAAAERSSDDDAYYHPNPPAELCVKEVTKFVESRLALFRTTMVTPYCQNSQGAHYTSLMSRLGLNWNPARRNPLSYRFSAMAPIDMVRIATRCSAPHDLDWKKQETLGRDRREHMVDSFIPLLSVMRHYFLRTTIGQLTFSVDEWRDNTILDMLHCLAITKNGLDRDVALLVARYGKNRAEFRDGAQQLTNMAALIRHSARASVSLSHSEMLTGALRLLVEPRGSTSIDLLKILQTLVENENSFGDFVVNSVARALKDLWEKDYRVTQRILHSASAELARTHTRLNKLRADKKVFGWYAPWLLFSGDIEGFVSARLTPAPKIRSLESFFDPPSDSESDANHLPPDNEFKQVQFRYWKSLEMTTEGRPGPEGGLQFQLYCWFIRHPMELLRVQQCTAADAEEQCAAKVEANWPKFEDGPEIRNMIHKMVAAIQADLKLNLRLPLRDHVIELAKTVWTLLGRLVSGKRMSSQLTNVRFAALSAENRRCFVDFMLTVAELAGGGHSDLAMAYLTFVDSVVHRSGLGMGNKKMKTTLEVGDQFIRTYRDKTQAVGWGELVNDDTLGDALRTHLLAPFGLAGADMNLASIADPLPRKLRATYFLMYVPLLTSYDLTAANVKRASDGVISLLNAIPDKVRKQEAKGAVQPLLFMIQSQDEGGAVHKRSATDGGFVGAYLKALLGHDEEFARSDGARPSLVETLSSMQLYQSIFASFPGPRAEPSCWFAPTWETVRGNWQLNALYRLIRQGVTQDALSPKVMSAAKASASQALDVAKLDPSDALTPLFKRLACNMDISARECSDLSETSPKFTWGLSKQFRFVLMLMGQLRASSRRADDDDFAIETRAIRATLGVGDFPRSRLPPRESSASSGIRRSESSGAILESPVPPPQTPPPMTPLKPQRSSSTGDLTRHWDSEEESGESLDDIRFNDPANRMHLDRFDPKVLKEWMTIASVEAQGLDRMFMFGVWSAGSCQDFTAGWEMALCRGNVGQFVNGASMLLWVDRADVLKLSDGEMKDLRLNKSWFPDNDAPLIARSIARLMLGSDKRPYVTVERPYFGRDVKPTDEPLQRWALEQLFLRGRALLKKIPSLAGVYFTDDVFDRFLLNSNVSRDALTLGCEPSPRGKALPKSLHSFGALGPAYVDSSGKGLSENGVFQIGVDMPSSMVFANAAAGSYLETPDDNEGIEGTTSSEDLPPESSPKSSPESSPKALLGVDDSDDRVDAVPVSPKVGPVDDVEARTAQEAERAVETMERDKVKKEDLVDDENTAEQSNEPREVPVSPKIGNVNAAPGGVDAPDVHGDESR